MFCKWCGNSIQLTDKKCPACGRETPPMSDCGGLYDLRHSVNGPRPQTQTCPRPVVMQCPIVEKMESKYARDRKATKNHHTISMVCFVLVLLAIVCSALLVLRANNQLDELKKQIVNIQNEMPTDSTEPTLDRPNGEQETAPPAESAQYHFTIDTTVINSEAKEIRNTYDFGNYTRSVKVTTTTATGKNGQAFTVSYLLDEDATIDLNLNYDQEEAKPLTIRVKCDTDLSFFTDQEFSYDWQYRSTPENWTSVDADNITVDDENDCHLICTTDWLKNITVENQPIELRCIVQVRNTSEDSMVITFGGISAAADGTIVTDNH